MPNPPIKFRPTQEKLVRAILSNEYRYLMAAGSIDSGKSYATALFFSMFATDFPNSRIGIIRRNISTIKRTILPTYKKALRDLGIPYKINRQDWSTQLLNGSNSELLFVEADHTKDPEFIKLHGLEITAAHMDEANEMVEHAFSILIQRVGRWNDNGAPDFIVLTCNPNNAWVKDKFYEPHQNGQLKAPYYFVEFGIDDIPKDRLENYKHLPPKEFERYVLNNWNYSDDPQQLIPFEWLKRNLVEPMSEADRLAVDVARYGDDRTILTTALGTRQSSIEVYRKQDTHTTAMVTIERLKEKDIGAENSIVDVVGLGAGVVDTMRAKGYNTRAYNSAEKPDYTAGFYEFKNLRSSSFWRLRELLENDEAKLLNDPEQIKELTNLKYMVKDKVIYIESKDEIKKRLGFSPDKADAVAMLFTVPSGGAIVSTGRNRALLQYDNLRNGNLRQRASFGKAHHTRDSYIRSGFKA